MDTNEAITVVIDDPSPHQIAREVFDVEQHFIRRYQRQMRRYTRMGNRLITLTGSATVWEAIGEKEKAAEARQKAQRLHGRRTELAEEIGKSVSALAHLNIDARGLAPTSPPRQTLQQTEDPKTNYREMWMPWSEYR